MHARHNNIVDVAIVIIIMNVIKYDTIEEVVIPIKFLCLSLSSLRLLKCTPTISQDHLKVGFIVSVTARSTNRLLKVASNIWYGGVQWSTEAATGHGLPV
jgi:hypothetical protein